MPKYDKSNVLLIGGGGLLSAATVLGTAIAALWFKDDLEDKGIPPGYGLAIGIALGMCFIASGFIRENRRLGEQLEDQHKPLRAKIDGLRGIEGDVENFFEGRHCEKAWSECGRVLLLHMQDAAKNYGLYERPDCSGERVALDIEGEPIEKFWHVYSMMRRKRKIPNRSWPDAVPEFQKLLLEDIRATIDFYERKLRD